MALIGRHLAALRGTIPKAELAQRVPTLASSVGINGKAKAMRSTQLGSWAFEDDNVGTHPIRNALGSGDTEHLQKPMSIPGPALYADPSFSIRSVSHPRCCPRLPSTLVL